jgi:DNA-binding winged helix-turn-helix (wHTH) protein/predicted ATPase
MKPARPGDPPAVRIEAENEWAWCGEHRLRLTPRAFAVLRHLVEHPQRLITKDDLLAAVWRDTIVSDAALDSCIRDLRRALGDSSRSPRYIQTVHRRGFRFIGPVDRSASGRPSPAPAAADLPDPTPDKPSALVGRDVELARLHASLKAALGGQRRLVFVTGEPGIGKTSLVEAFLGEIGEGTAIGRGQCVEQYGSGEPYLPVLEALGRLGREARGEQLVRVFTQYAPSWLAQLPALLTDHDLEVVQRRAQGSTRDRMLRELVEALEILSVEVPLVLVLEDLHWSDSATIDVLAMLGRRREAARLLVLGTYRPADVAGGTHPLGPVTQELQLHGRCEEVSLDFLGAATVGEYLARRFPRHGLPPELAGVLQRTTEGNPLFLVATVDDLIAHGQLREIDGQWRLAGQVQDIAVAAPETLGQMVERQFDRLTADEQAMLEVASVAGAEFSVALAVAAGIDAADAERRCAALAHRGQFLRAAGVAAWPDGTVAGRYAFIHALYQSVLYARASIGRRVGLHVRIAERLERAYGERAGEIAGELAVHFEQGRSFERAVRYRRHAGEHALRQHAYREAATHATRALESLSASPNAGTRAEDELTLQVMLGAAMTAIKGYSAPEVEWAYSRARELCERVGNEHLVPVLLGLARFYVVRAELESAREVVMQLLAMAEGTGDTTLLVASHNALGNMCFYRGEFESALTHLERALEVYDPRQHSPNRSAGFRFGQDPGVSCTVHVALTLQALGRPARAAARMADARTLAASVDHPMSVAYASHFAAGLHQWRGERDAMQELEKTAVAQATELGLGIFLMAGSIESGWLLCEQGRSEEGIAQMRGGIAAHRAIGAEIRTPAFLALLADGYRMLDRKEEGRAVVDEALDVGARTGQHYWDAELHRLKAALTPEEPEAESCLRRAIDVARSQHALSFELRAATGLARLWAAQGKAKDAHALLAEVYGRFTEGFETADLTAASTLLEELRGRRVSTRSGPRRARASGR